MGRKKDAENIRVVIRVRPLNQKEKETGKEAVHPDLGTGSISVNHAVGEPDRFTFDAVYDNTFSQREIFNNEVKPLVQSVLDGYNATVFAYGQSGSGKTFTMTGVPGTDKAGLMPNALDAIFHGIRQLETTTKTYRVKISYLELYNGKARDLFDKKQTNLEIKQNSIKNFYVKGLDAFEVSTTAECLRLFDEGTDRRKTASTDLNEHSSRSHAIFTVHIVSTDHDDAGSPVVMNSKLNLCDLAGSERQSKTNTTGDALREGCNINLSLSALGTVIDTLVKGKQHIPYRSSPLTMLLKDSLGGNSKTVMFANIGPADMNTAETISTLRFADRAKQIENKPVKNLDPKDQMIVDLKEEIEMLKKRLSKGGGGDLEKEQEMEAKLERMEFERDQERQDWERGKLDLEEQVRLLERQVKELEEMVEKLEKDLADAGDRSKVGNTQVDELKDQLGELKKMNMSFIQGILPEEIVADVASHQIEGDEADGVWARTKIQDMQDAAIRWMKEEKKKVSEAEIGEKVAAATEDFQTKIKAMEEQHKQDMRSLEEEFAIKKKRLVGEAEDLADTKASLEIYKERLKELKEKIKKDHEKFKAKLATGQQELAEKTDELGRVKEEADDLRRKLSQAGNEMTASIDKVKQEAKKQLEDAELAHKKQQNELQQKLGTELEAKEAEKDALEHRLKRFEINRFTTATHPNKLKKNKGQMRTDDDDDIGDAANDGFVDEGEHVMSAGELAQLDDRLQESGTGILSELGTQLRFQLKLQSLRWTQQKHLDTLVARYTAAAQDSRGKIKVEEHQKEVEALRREKEEEYKKLQDQKEREQEKIVKKYNQLNTKLTNGEREWQKEKEDFQEQLRESRDQYDLASKCSEQLMGQVQQRDHMLADKEEEVSRMDRRREREVMQVQRELQSCEEEISRQRETIARLRESERQGMDMRKEHEIAKVQLRDQRGQVEATRQRLKHMEELYTNEKQRSESLRNKAEDAHADKQKTEEYYQDMVRENGQKMSKILHERLAAERDQYAEKEREHEVKVREKMEKLRKAKQREQKAKQKFDEMVLENEQLRVQLEESKVEALRLMSQGAGDDTGFHDQRRDIELMVRRQKDLRMEQDAAFTGRPPSREMRGSGY